MAKNDLFKKEWLDVVFENRNKAYGAYNLRLQSSRTTTLSIVGGICLFSAVFVIPALVSNLMAGDGSLVNKGVINTIPNIDKPVVLDKIEPLEKKETPKLDIPTEKIAQASLVDQVKYTAFKPVKSTDATDDVPKMSDFDEADPGPSTIKGNEGGTVVLNAPVGLSTEGSEGGTVVKEEDEEKGNDIIHVVQYKAEPYEGLAKFSQNFVTRFRSLPVDSNVKEMRVILTFVVEKDGSLTDIKVLRDPGYGAGAEAIRVLKTMNKWKSAEQNNKKVRSQFTLPITINVQ
ncbi:MAG: energy transducer TonB [Flavobacteriaceae bacterium]|jgi:protein TonB|nr:energy transducer TonB [Flavobacteriaceae bacterium]